MTKPQRAYPMTTPRPKTNPTPKPKPAKKAGRGKTTLPPSSDSNGSFYFGLRKHESEESSSYDPSTLGTSDPRFYLRNRLHNACLAGFDAAEKFYKSL